MSKSLKKLSLLGILGVFLLGGSAAQQIPGGDTHGTGLIPLDAKQLDEIIASWPRINKVNFNWLGFDRVNKIKTKKGKSLLRSFSIKPVGQEVESSIWAPGATIQSISLNPELVGDLPVFVDNSTTQFFPPIRDQGNIGSCACFASTYYQLSYMTAFQRGLDIRDNNDNTNKYSPKWTYNMLNSGVDGGTYINQNYFLLARHGASTWAEFPYDTDYLAWCLDPAAWRNALNVRTNTYQYAYYTNTDSGLEQIKELLTNGYILVFGTYVNSWQFRTIQDDPSTLDDDSAVGKYIGYWVNGTLGSHAMTIVGYNDAIWTDINGNGNIDTGEKGALRIANSWGSDWNAADGGFIWLAYDALKSVSAVPGGPSAGRQAAFQGSAAYVSTARDNYSPKMIAEFTVNHAKRSQLELTLGLSDLSSTTPTMLWTSWMLRNMGGAHAFDGTATAIDGTFVFDFTDILVGGGGWQRYFLSMNDNAAGDAATLSAFKIIDTTTDPDTEVVYTPVPLNIDNGQIYAYIDYTYLGDAVNELPSIWNPQVTPTSGTTLNTYTYFIEYIDADGDVPSVKNVFIDAIPHEMALYSGTAANGWYYFQTSLDTGVHNYRFYFEDGRGGAAQNPLLLATISGPIVVLPHIISMPNTLSGEQNPDIGPSYAYSTGGSTCNQGHDIQYRFDWGDGAVSDWLLVGQSSTTHAWSSSGSFAVKAQARCAAATAVVSSWSNPLAVFIPACVPFLEAFSTSAFPAGWTQQNPTTTNLWSVISSSNAGGSPYEMRCRYASGTATTRLATLPIDTTGISTLRLRFKHFLDTWSSGGVQLKIQTSPDGTTWTDEAWMVTTSSSNIGPATVDTVLTHNLNISTTYVGFVLTGNLLYFDYWYIDDVSIASPSHKVDFNGDGQEDILWRYYGPGGSNRAWFLGSAGMASPPLSMVDPQKEAGPAGSKIIRNSASRKIIGNPRDMGLISNRKTESPMKGLQDVMGAGNRRAAGIATVNDPRKAGRGKTEAGVFTSPLSIADPRQAKLAVNSQTLSDNIAELAATKPLLGGADVMPVGDLNWQVRGTGDFNGDGNVDILWRYNGPGGYNVVWFMNGTNWIGSAELLAVDDLNWQIVGTGDFNRDGNVDILWRYNGFGGYNVVWYMNGANWIGSAELLAVDDLNWQIVGTGDFNRDGNVDILWRYNGSGGYNVVWYMNGANWAGSVELISVADLNWQIAGTGDYNNDGNVDILWRYNGSGGYNYIWYLNGANWIGGEDLLPVAELTWKIVSR